MGRRTDATVYVVDDDSAVRESLSVLLGTFGFRTEAFESAEDFLAAHAELPPCCLIVDLRLPGISGLELLQRLSKEKRDIPAFLITGHGDAQVLEAAERHGVVKCFRKPFDSKELVSSIQHVLCP